MEEKDFEVLRVLNETRSITQAAEKLYMTQSALSRRLRTIEEELGADLVVRSRQGVRFTPAGEMTLVHSRSAARELEQMRRELAVLQRSVGGTLKAGLSVHYATYHLPTLVAEYHRRYPEVKLKIQSGASSRLYRQLQEGGLDAVVIIGDHPWDEEKWLLRQERICLIRPYESMDAPLSELPYIHREPEPVFAARVARWLRDNGLGAVEPTVTTLTVGSCVELVKQGLGWGLVPESGLEDFSGSITPCTFANGEPFERASWLLCRRDAMELPQVMAFVDAVRRFG